ncbi:MAG: YbaN family protein [Prevotellaceae bacterium]|jgi:uncharacterized membrane protein YbaN (DUF454 family)|nr:YbaN family protein [Prevotellaceae bacterium]
MFVKLKKIFLVTLGSIFLGLGILGIFLPLLPTTPFLLLTTICYAKSSRRLLKKLLANRLVGKYITEYQQNKGIRKSIKIYVLSLLWTTIMLSIIFFADAVWLKILLGCVAVGVTIHISTFKTL